MSAFYNVDQPPFNMGSVARAIAAANNGLLFDIGDMSTLFQDAAGTIPVTAVEMPVGKIIDKSGNGNHATQSITASRPVLSARKNILLATEALATQSVTTIAAQYTLSFTGTGSVTLSGSATGTLTGTGAANRVSLTVTPTAGTLTLTVSGSVTKAQLELGATVCPYQRVNTSTDYDTNPAFFPKYLKFDGVDDYLNFPYMGLYANGSASVVASLMLVPSTSEYTLVAERSTANSWPAYRLAMKGASNQLTSQVRLDDGTTYLNAAESSAANLATNINRVFSVIDSGNKFSPRINSIIGSEKFYTRSGTLTLNNTVLGATVTTTSYAFMSGRFYGLIITKSALTDAQRVRCERFLAQKAGVML